ncbi:MAG: hypothetical protein WCA35_14710 [Kovacikia sp.]
MLHCSREAIGNHYTGIPNCFKVTGSNLPDASPVLAVWSHPIIANVPRFIMALPPPSTRQALLNPGMKLSAK